LVNTSYFVVVVVCVDGGTWFFVTHALFTKESG
jgi:hypothetical protein